MYSENNSTLDKAYVKMDEREPGLIYFPFNEFESSAIVRSRDMFIHYKNILETEFSDSESEYSSSYLSDEPDSETEEEKEENEIFDSESKKREKNMKAKETLEYFGNSRDIESEEKLLPHPVLWTVDGVQTWLELIGCKGAMEVFRYHNVDGKLLLSVPTSDYLHFRYGVEKRQVRWEIMLGIERLIEHFCPHGVVDSIKNEATILVKEELRQQKLNEKLAKNFLKNLTATKFQHLYRSWLAAKKQQVLKQDSKNSLYHNFQQYGEVFYKLGVERENDIICDLHDTDGGSLILAFFLHFHSAQRFIAISKDDNFMKLGRSRARKAYIDLCNDKILEGKMIEFYRNPSEADEFWQKITIFVSNFSIFSVVSEKKPEDIFHEYLDLIRRKTTRRWDTIFFMTISPYPFTLPCLKKNKKKRRQWKKLCVMSNVLMANGGVSFQLFQLS